MILQYKIIIIARYKNSAMSKLQTENHQSVFFNVSPTLQEVFPYVESEKFDMAIGQLTYQIFAIEQQIQDILKENGIVKKNDQNIFRGTKVQPHSSLHIQAENMQLNQNQPKVKNPINNMLSMLYLNRGILEFCKGRVSEALTDLQKSSAFNYLNYCAYFNSHSIYFRMYEAFKASGVDNKKIMTQFLEHCLNDIGCALSCLYLLYSCLNKNKNPQIHEQYLDKAIKYCSNNIDARLKKAFILFSCDQFKNCTKMLNWIIEIGGQQKISKMLNKIQESNLDNDKSSTDIEWMKPSEKTYMDFRLMYDLMPEISGQGKEEKLIDEITSKQTQFINVYDEINKIDNFKVKMGILRKIKIDLNKTMNINSSLNLKQQNKQQITNLYLLSRDFPTSIIDDSSAQDHSALRKSKSVDTNEKPFLKVKESKVKTDDDMEIEAPFAKNPEEISASKIVEIGSSIQEENVGQYHYQSPDIDKVQSEQAKVAEPARQQNKTESIKQQMVEISQHMNDKSESLIKESNIALDDAMEGSVSEIQSEVIDSSLVLQPLDQEKHLGISVHKVEINGSPEQKSKLKHLYCLFEYDGKAFKSILLGEDYNNQNWDDELETPLGDEPKELVVKVYHKEVLAFEDKFYGSGSKQITVTGRVEIPLYCVGSSSGKVIIDIKYK